MFFHMAPRVKQANRSAEIASELMGVVGVAMIFLIAGLLAAPVAAANSPPISDAPSPLLRDAFHAAHRAHTLYEVLHSKEIALDPQEIAGRKRENVEQAWKTLREAEEQYQKELREAANDPLINSKRSEILKTFRMQIRNLRYDVHTAEAEAEEAKNWRVREIAALRALAQASQNEA